MNGRMAHAPKLNKAARGRVFALLELNDRLLVGLVLAAVVFLIAYFAVLKLLPTAWQTPGSPPLYILGIIGAALLLVSLLFVGVSTVDTVVRRRPGSQRMWWRRF
jgi:hypothetical protein